MTTTCETTVETTLENTRPDPTRTVIPARYAPYVTEAIGTLVLVFTVGAAVRGGSALAPLAIGSVLMAMVYAGGHLSGAHYNPAVTLAALVRRRIELRTAAGYVAAQVVGSLGGAALAAVVVPVPHGAGAPLTLVGSAVVAGFVAELLFTFVLCYVVLNVATSKDHPGNSFYGMAIGFTVAAGAVAVGGTSGAVFNPAVLVGGTVLGLFGPSSLWVYLLAQGIAGVTAGLVFRALNPGDE